MTTRKIATTTALKRKWEVNLPGGFFWFFSASRGFGLMTESASAIEGEKEIGEREKLLDV